MKKFSDYQYIGGEMSERDKLEVGSKFWNEGKWNNFIAPFLEENLEDMTFVDMGCNAGLFLKLAEINGFDRIIGVDSDKKAVERGIEHRNEINGTYRMWLDSVEDAILPMADYTVLANVHYYLNINDWLEYVDKLQYKTMYCIIVTDEARRNPLHKTSASLKSIANYFKLWKYERHIRISGEGDSHPRKLLAILFKSPLIERVEIKDLDNGNHQQDGFYKQIDDDIVLEKTNYYRRMKSYRLKEHSWSQEKLDSFMQDKARLYKDVKKNGIMNPIIINENNRIVDGNHRCAMMKHLGYKTILARKVL